VWKFRSFPRHRVLTENAVKEGHVGIFNLARKAMGERKRYKEMLSHL
jgi:hypothetical protein